MIEKQNAALVQAIHAHTPDSLVVAGVVADTLGVSREAAYRRLRGEVPFSFGEAAQLSERLRFSLDRITNTPAMGGVQFRLKFTDFTTPIDTYAGLLERDTAFFREASTDPTAVFATATNNIPAEYYLRYPHLGDFKLFKWLYQHGLGNSRSGGFEQMQVPESLHRCYHDYVAAVQLMPAANYVFDDSGFVHWINALRAFRAMGLLTEQSVEQIRDELARLIDDLERIAMDGGYENGNKVSLYLSDVDIDAAYSYVSTTKYNAVGIEIFSLNALRSSDAQFFNYVKRWIVTQSRFSTLISSSGELRRIQFFRQQRELLEAMVIH